MNNPNRNTQFGVENKKLSRASDTGFGIFMGGDRW